MSIFSDAVNIAEETYDKAVKGAEKMLERVEDTLTEVENELERVGSEIADIASDVEEEMEELFHSAVDSAAATFDSAWAMIERNIETTIGLVEAVPAAFTDADTAWDIIEGAVLQPFVATEQALEDSWNAAAQGTVGAIENLATSWETAYDVATNTGNVLIDQLAHSYEEHVRITEMTIQVVGEDLRDMTKLTVELGACTAGGIIYSLAKSDAVVYNFTPPVIARTINIPSALRRALQAIPQFASIDFDRVSYVNYAHLPADYFGDATGAMTFSGVHLGPAAIDQVILISRAYDSSLLGGHTTDISIFGRRDLAHELVHAMQAQHMGEMGFACAYGVGYAEAGFNYYANPLEAQAFAYEPLVF